MSFDGIMWLQLLEFFGKYWENILRGIVVLTYNDDDADDDDDDTMVGKKKNSVSKELGNTFCGSQAISFRYEISR